MFYIEIRVISLISEISVKNLVMGAIMTYPLHAAALPLNHHDVTV